VVLCANCHAVAHMLRPWVTLTGRTPRPAFFRAMLPEIGEVGPVSSTKVRHREPKKPIGWEPILK
jgi:hypothetical protein